MFAGNVPDIRRRGLRGAARHAIACARRLLPRCHHERASLRVGARARWGAGVRGLLCPRDAEARGPFVPARRNLRLVRFAFEPMPWRSAPLAAAAPWLAACLAWRLPVPSLVLPALMTVLSVLLSVRTGSLVTQRALRRRTRDEYRERELYAEGEARAVPAPPTTPSANPRRRSTSAAGAPSQGSRSGSTRLSASSPRAWTIGGSPPPRSSARGRCETALAPRCRRRGARIGRNWP